MPTPTAALHAAFDADQFRNQAHKLIDRLAGYLSASTGGSHMPVLPRVTPNDLLAAWPARFVGGPGGRFDELVARLVAGSNHLHHPHFVGHQVSPVLPLAALSEMVVSLLNNSNAIFEMGPSGNAIERNLISWFTRTVGWSSGAGGVLTSGGALANLTALLAARQAKAGGDPWSDGSSARLAVLASEEAHYSIDRAVRIMGWGRHGAVPVPTDEQFRMRAAALEDSYGAATRAGLKVIAVVANACSTATGTYDPLEEIADFCAERNLWFHVDAAHGAVALLSQRYKPLIKGVERADSLVWDAHKMMLMPLLVSAVLFRDRAAGDQAFAQRASYLFDEGRTAGDEDLGTRTFECSKPALGFALYAALMTYGTEIFAAYVEESFDLARAFAGMIRESGDFELAVEPDANIVCFRYAPAGRRDLDSLQSRIRQKIVGDGLFYLVQTRLPAGLFLRTTLINPFTSTNDLKELMDTIRHAAA
jgi:L-2,4-diaminobutyrate decarboxylase